MPGREKSYSHKIYWVGVNTGQSIANYWADQAPVLLSAQEITSRQESIDQYFEAGFGQKGRSKKRANN